MENLFKPIKILGVVLLLTILIAGLLLVNYQYFVGHADVDEFRDHWDAARAFLVGDKNPFSEIAASPIQPMTIEGQDELFAANSRMVAPIYAELLFIPFALIENYLTARVAWMLVLELSIMAAVWFSFQILDWHPKPLLFSTFLVFSTLWFPSVQSVTKGSLTIIAFFLLIAALSAIRAHRDDLAGIFMALSTIHPQTMFLMIILLILWALFQRRMQFLLWFFGAGMALILLGMLLIPSWPLQYMGALLSHFRSGPLSTIHASLIAWLPGIGHNFGKLIEILVMIALVWGWWMARMQRYRVLVWAACITIILTLWMTSFNDLSMLVMLLIVFALIFSVWVGRWPQFGPWAAIIGMFILTVGSWLFFSQNTEMSLQMYSIFIFLPVFLLIAMKWVQWWYLRFPVIQ
ncbi:MAG: glycosyltransferase family 87 protein [Chloroflexota bacterium]